MEKNQEKTRWKRKSFWSKCSSLFGRSTKVENVNESWRQVEQETQMSQMMVNTQPLDMERWGPEESIDANSQLLNIPIEPGRQVSTIIFSPTKTGFKAVIAHYGINTDLAQSLTKDVNSVSAQLDNRRTLTLVFDMNTTRFDDVATGKSESSLVETNHSDGGKSCRSMSASALFVRTGVDDVVESAAFLQTRLSLENSLSIQTPILLPEEKLAEADTRHLSCRSLKKSRVAFKTISEPLWQDKQKMRNEMVMKQNIQEVLNQFIFLDRDDSLMNYPRLSEEVPSKRDNIFEGKPITYEDPLLVKLLRRDEEDVTTDQTEFTSKMSFSFERLSELTPSSARNVAPDLLVNIKPFKQRISVYTKPDFGTDNHNFQHEKTRVFSKKPPMMLRQSGQNIVRRNAIAEKTIKPKEIVCKPEPQHPLSFDKSRLSVCIRCGAKAKADESKPLKGKYSRMSGNMFGKNTGNEEPCRKKSFEEMMSEQRECNLCSMWKMYNKTSFGSISLSSDSVDDILKEFDEYDHNSMFRQNLSQFRRKIIPSASPVEFKTSHSSLSFAEVIELENGKLIGMKNSKESNNEDRSSDFPKVTLRLIEYVRKTEGKTIQLERIKRGVGKLEIEDLTGQRTKIIFMENSNVACIFRATSQIVKVMAQKSEEYPLTRFVITGDTFVPQETLTIICPAYADVLPKTSIVKHCTENKIDEFKGSFCKRTGQIPDVISHLWMDKIDDLRNELITRMNETRICYDPSNQYSAHLIRLNESQKATSKCSVATTTSQILTVKDDNEARVNGLDKSSIPSAEKPEKSGIQETSTQNSSVEQFVATRFLQGKGLLQDEESKEIRSEDLQSTGLNDHIISFTNPDFKIHSCLTFFVPFIEQIQTAVEILNSAMYSFPVRKLEDHVDRNCLRILRSCTLLPDKKKYFTDNELESVILKKCIEKNVVSGVTTSTTSKMEIMTIKGSKSGNHLLVTNKKILTKNDRIKKSGVITGGTEYEVGEKTNKVDESHAVLRGNASEEMEDQRDVHCLYYKQVNGNETGESSEASNYSQGKVSESQSSVIAVSELEEIPPPERLLSSKQIGSVLVGENADRRNDDQSQMKSHSINLLQKTCQPSDEGDDSKSPESSVGERKFPSKTTIKSIQSAPPDPQSESLRVTEEKSVVNEGDERSMMIREKLKTSHEEIIRNIGEGVRTQRLVAKKIGGKIIICRGDNCSPSDKQSQSKRMSVLVTLSRHVPERKNSKSYGSERRTRGLIKTVEAKCLEQKPNDFPKDEVEPAKFKTAIRSQENSYITQRKRSLNNRRDCQNIEE